MIPEKVELASIIPHRGRMLLLSRIKEYNLKENTLSAEYDITEDCLFYDPAIGAVPAWVGFEFMAQAISALIGLWRLERGEELRIGFIMSVSSMRIGFPSFKAGSSIEVKVKQHESMDPVYSFAGEIFFEGRKVIEGRLSVMDAMDEQIEALKKGV